MQARVNALEINPSSVFSLIVLLWILLLFVSFLSLLCCLVCFFSLVVTYLERADPLSLLCVVFLCFVTFPYGVVGQARYFIVCPPLYLQLLYEI